MKLELDDGCLFGVSGLMHEQCHLRQVLRYDETRVLLSAYSEAISLESLCIRNGFFCREI